MYSAGVMMLEMLMSKLPYPPYGTAMDLLKMKLALKDRLFLQRPSEVHPVANRTLDDILFKALAFDRDQRYASCHEFASELERFSKKLMTSSSAR
jgi:serine/threonine-protein kinase